MGLIIWGILTGKKGVSGNPGGRPKGVLEVIHLARENTPAIIRRLTEIVLHSKNESAVVAACKLLLDRGWGQAPASVTLTDEYDPAMMTDEELDAALAELDDKVGTAARLRALSGKKH